MDIVSKADEHDLVIVKIWIPRSLSYYLGNENLDRILQDFVDKHEKIATIETDLTDRIRTPAELEEEILTPGNKDDDQVQRQIPTTMPTSR